jgi:hypothetical protein
MGSRCTIRLPKELHARLQLAASTSGVAAADVMRQALVAFLDGRGSAGNSPPYSLADQPALAPHDGEAASPPGPPAARVSGAARPRLREMPSWEEFKRRRLQGSGASLPATSPASTPE